LPPLELMAPASPVDIARMTCLADVLKLWTDFNSAWWSILMTAVIIGLPIAVIRGLIAQSRENQERALIQKQVEEAKEVLRQRDADAARMHAKEEQAVRAAERTAREAAEAEQLRLLKIEAETKAQQWIKELHEELEEHERQREEQRRNREEEARKEEAEHAALIKRVRAENEDKRTKRLRLEQLKELQVSSGAPISAEDQVEIASYERLMDPILTRREKLTRGRIISFFSPEGSPGRTFLATNLASALGELTGEIIAVVTLDFDMGGPLAYFGREPTASIRDLLELGECSDIVRIREIGLQLGDHLWCYEARFDPAVETPAGEEVARFLRSLQANFAWVIVDASGGMSIVDSYSAAGFACFGISDLICWVTRPNSYSTMYVAEILERHVEYGLSADRYRVVVNRADPVSGTDTTALEAAIGAPVTALIQESPLVANSLSKGLPVVLAEPASDISASLLRLAQSWIDERAALRGNLDVRAT
jgi:MinD-like ATPase involved in chromosome partitioning or flagellar assembly